jgi:dihydroflavonol-4-reductase
MLTLVTGATGYLGVEVCRVLTAEGRPLRALVRGDAAAARLDGLPVERVRGDVTDPASLVAALAGVARVYHLAGVVGHRRAEEPALEAVNVGGARNVLDAAGAAGVERVVFASSVAALGPAPAPDARRDESNWLADDAPPEFRYARSKLRGERIAQQAVAGGLDVVIANPGFVIGPGDVHRVSSWPVEEYLRGLLRFTVPGGLSYVDARDVAAGLLLVERAGRAGERYVLTCEEGNLPHRDFFALVGRTTGVRRRTAHVPAGVLAPLLAAGARLRLPFPLDDQELRASAHWWFFTAARARRELGFTTRPIEETVADTAAWLRADGYRRH